MNRPKAILFGAALAATLPAFNGPVHAAESTDPVTLTASHSPGSGLYNLRLTLTDGPKHASNFAVDTGSTGILGGAAFFGLTAREKDPAKCTTFGYSSSGNSYTAYPVTRSFNLSTPGKRDGYARVEGKTLANDTTVVLYDSPEGGQELTRLTYSDKTPGSRCLRWSTGHPKSAGWLYNSGQDFFRNCGLFFDPTAHSARIDCKQS